MRKNKVMLAMLFVSVAGFFTSCIDDVVNDEGPVITVSSPASDSIDIFIGDSVDFSIALSAENGLTNFKAMVSATGIELSNSNLTFNDTNNESVTVTAKVTEIAAVGNATVTFVVEDGLKSANETKVLVISKNETPLSEAADFEWKRVGGNDATGLEQFGLTWTENTSTSAVIKKGADKFVELAAENWTGLSSVETLAEAIEAADDMDRWEKISAEESKTYDLTLGTKVETTYYLIHITNATVATDAVAGTTITVIGQYKE